MSNYDYKIKSNLQLQFFSSKFNSNYSRLLQKILKKHEKSTVQILLN